MRRTDLTSTLKLPKRHFQGVSHPTHTPYSYGPVSLSVCLSVSHSVCLSVGYPRYSVCVSASHGTKPITWCNVHFVFYVDPINILLVGCGDCRHILKTIAKTYKWEKTQINVNKVA
jgi:hypothetical protein